MLSHLRRTEGNLMPTRTTNGHSDRANGSFQSSNYGTDVHTTRSNPALYNPDLSRALRFDAYLLAIVRVEDKKNAFYSAEVVSKLRQKEQTQSFINKPCSLFVTDRTLVVFDRGTQTVAESIPLENVDPTCVHADVPDRLNDIFMYRLLNEHIKTTAGQAVSPFGNETSPVVVFKCANNEAKTLVDSIRNAIGKPLRNLKSGAMERRITESYNHIPQGSGGFSAVGAMERRITESYNHIPQGSGGFSAVGTTLGMENTGSMQRTTVDTTNHTNSASHLVNSQQTRTITQQTTIAATDYYKRLTEELNKCFDDIELFVRYLEALTEYTKELERDHRRKEKRSTMGLKQMIEKLPDDRYFVDVLQKFKHSFNLLGELKHIIHNPNAPELIHYLLSPLQFILHTLRSKHMTQLKLAQDIWTPALTKEARDLLLNCLTSREHEILRNLGPAWVRTSDETTPKFSDYRPVFFDGHPIWIQDGPIAPLPLQSARTIERTTTVHPFTQYDERAQSAWTSTRQIDQNDHNNHNNGLVVTQNTTFVRQTSPTVGQFDTSTVDRSVKNGIMEDYNYQMQNEHAWAIDRKRAGAKVYAVKTDRKGQNAKELTVHRGELVEIEDSSKKWWRARNFRGEVGHVPNNIVEEIEIEHRPLKISPSIPSVVTSHRSLTNTNSRSRYN